MADHAVVTCPFCGCVRTNPVQMDGWHRRECVDCLALSPPARDEAGAMRYWLERVDGLQGARKIQAWKLKLQEPNLSTGQIAKRLKLSKRTIFRYFEHPPAGLFPHIDA